MTEPFKLDQDRVRPKRQRFDVSNRTLQKKLFAGLECDPDQRDLFQTDGEQKQGDENVEIQDE